MTPPALPDQFQPFNQPEFTAPDKPKFRLHKFLDCLRKYWWLPLVTLAITCTIGGIDVYFMPASYTSIASMWSPAKLRIPDSAAFTEDTETFLGTQSELLQTPKVRNLALERLAAHGEKIPKNKDGEPLEVAIRLSQNPKSRVFTLQATGENAAFTKAYLDALMHAYLDNNKQDRELITSSALSSITEQINQTDKDLQEQQEILNNFKQTNNLTILQLEAASVGQYLINLKTKLSDLQLQDELLEATMHDDRTNIASGNDHGSSSDLNSASAVSPSYTTAYQTLQTLYLERDKLSKYLRDKHPKMVKLDEQIDHTKRLLEIYARESYEQRVADRERIQLEMTNIVVTIKEWESKAIRNNTLVAQADQLKANVQRYQDMAAKWELLIQNVSVTRNIDQDTLTILEPASDAFTSYSRIIGVLKTAVVFGLGSGFGLILLLSIKDDRFNNVVEFNERLGDTVIGQIPDIQVLNGKAPLLLDEGENQYMLAESYRNLRSALLFMAVNGARPKTILITSALPNEGKSTVAANLAQALALCGSRVVLIDCDLRKGVIHERMGLQREPGITELLRGTAVLEQVIQISSSANLSFIARGKSTGESADLFLGVKFAQVIAWLRDQFDYVLIDSSPVLATDEATTLAPMVDGTLMVVRGNFTGGKQVNEALNQLYQRQAKILGVVFNRANASSRSYQYYKYKEYQPVKEV